MCNLFIPFNLHKCTYISLIVFAIVLGTPELVWSMVAEMTVIDAKIEFYFKNKLMVRPMANGWARMRDLCLFMRVEAPTTNYNRESDGMTDGFRRTLIWYLLLVGRLMLARMRLDEPVRLFILRLFML